jgi:hypothetical protein
MEVYNMVDGQAGKGSKYRPVDQKKYDENWEKAFGSKKKKNSKKGRMQAGGIYDMTDIPQSEDTNEKDKQT